MYKMFTSFNPFFTAMNKKNTQLRTYLFDKFYMHEDIYRMNKRGQEAIKLLFKAYEKDTNLLPLKVRLRIQDEPMQQVIADYISGMTDTFALNEAHLLRK